MLTRDIALYQYCPTPVGRVSLNGAVRLNGSEYQYVMYRGGSLPLTPSRPHLEMDPSDPSTWQRPYRFTERLDT